MSMFVLKYYCYCPSNKIYKLPQFVHWVMIPSSPKSSPGKEKQTVIPTQGMSARKEGDRKGCRGEGTSPSPSGEQDLNRVGKGTRGQCSVGKREEGGEAWQPERAHDLGKLQLEPA